MHTHILSTHRTGNSSHHAHIRPGRRDVEPLPIPPKRCLGYHDSQPVSPTASLLASPTCTLPPEQRRLVLRTRRLARAASHPTWDESPYIPRCSPESTPLHWHYVPLVADLVFRNSLFTRLFLLSRVFPLRSAYSGPLRNCYRASDPQPHKKGWLSGPGPKNMKTLTQSLNPKMLLQRSIARLL